MTASVDVIRQVFDDNERAFLEVGPHPDAPDVSLELRTGDSQTSQEWFGRQSFSMSADFAIVLGRALIAAGEEMKAKQ
jgi:hypothetical protein